MLPCPVLDNDQVAALADMRELVDVVESCFIAKAERRLVAPPRHAVNFAGPDLVFTVGGVTETGGGLAGFRVYETSPGAGAAHSQLTAVWDTRTHDLVGLIFGDRLGALRAGAIGGVAVRHMAPDAATTCGVIGTGRQAETQVMAVMAVRPSISRIRVYGRNSANRETFAARLAQRYGIDIRSARTAREAVDGAAIVICATSSEQPVIESAWLAPRAHVNALGAKASDHSPDQVRATRPGFFLDGTPAGAAMLDLADAVSGKSPMRRTSSDVTLFCSVGLAGTEVVIANALLRRAGRMA